MERIKTIIRRLRFSVAGKRAFKRTISIFLIVSLFKIKFHYNFTSHALTDLSLRCPSNVLVFYVETHDWHYRILSTSSVQN